MQTPADAPSGVNEPRPNAAAPDGADPMAADQYAESSAAVLGQSAITPQAFLNDAVAQLASLLDIGACAVLLQEDDLRPVAAVGLADGYVPALDAAHPPPGFRSHWSIPLALPDGRALGHFLAYSPDRDGPDERTLEMARAFGSVVALALDRLTRQWGLAARYQAVVVALSSALDTRDEYSGTRLSGASSLAIRVGQRLGIKPEGLDVISQVAVLHDIGKLGVPGNVLRKPGPLDADEQALIREHPVIGERILGTIPGLGEVARAIRHEHERWDGGGYPDGLAGDQIPLASRIVFACATWYAMTSDRPYRAGMSTSEALRELREGAGTQFDPRVAQALLEILGEVTPPDACSPSESRHRELSRQLAGLAAQLGAEDLFVFRRVAGQVYSHLDGAGQGAGWAGNIELDSTKEQHLLDAVSAGEPRTVELEQMGRVVGPYYARSAVIVPCADDTVVVFGSSGDSLASVPVEDSLGAAEQAHALVVDVSPAKRLADELEVLSAMREVMAVTADSMSDALAAIALKARMALSAEFTAVATIPSNQMDAEVGVSAGAWEPSGNELTTGAMAFFTERATDLPILYQDVTETTDPPEGFRQSDGVSSIHVLPIGRRPEAILLVVHATPGLRGFTELCQRVATGMSDAAEVVIRRADAQERLRDENARLARVVRTDALTGVASRAAWEGAMYAEELHRARSGAPMSVVIIDVDQLKTINDKAGHAAGDELLRQSAAVLAESVRATDLVARIGGDEFGVLLRYTNAEQAEAWCARLDERLRELEGPKLSWSVGFASVPPHETLAAALHDADRRMYMRKKRTRRSWR
jgi:diguanylate cyclase (GGDEF)-like protein